MISFFSEDTDFAFKGKIFTRKWLKLLIEKELHKTGDISVIFCSDKYLLDINRKFLQHDYFTDIITFDYCEGSLVSGDLFISVDSVKDNAQEYGTEFNDELNRVIVHGVLHLLGYDDHTDAQTKQMREKENEYLALKADLQDV